MGQCESLLSTDAVGAKQVRASSIELSATHSIPAGPLAGKVAFSQRHSRDISKDLIGFDGMLIGLHVGFNLGVHTKI